jgi:hypothetical protein
MLVQLLLRSYHRATYLESLFSHLVSQRCNFSLFNKIFSGNKPCQLWIKTQRFGDHFRFHHQGNDVKVGR